MKRLLACGCFVLLWVLGSAASLSAQDLAIVNGRIVVGNGTVIESGTVVIRNGRIASVAAGNAGAAGLKQIDAKGMTLMPGFIDGHRHIINGNADEYFKTQAQARMKSSFTGTSAIVNGAAEGPPPGGHYHRRQPM